MLIQSWGGKIRIFPAVPDAWKDVAYSGLRTEGAFILFDADGTPLAVVEAKRTSVDATVGRHQAELYADCLATRYTCSRPVIYYTNGFETHLIDNNRHSISLPPFSVIVQNRLLIM